MKRKGILSRFRELSWRRILSPSGLLVPIYREGLRKDFRRLLLVIILLCISIAYMHAQTDRKYIRKGNGSYNDGNYKQAELDYRKALEDNPSSSKADYNLGNALYKQGQFDAAAGRYNSLIQQNYTSTPGHTSTPRPTERSRSATSTPGHSTAERSRSAASTSDLSRYYYNLGNALFQSQKYRESIEAYKMSLRNNPSDLDAKHNLQLALRLMHEAEQQKQQGGGSQQDQNKEQQEKQQQEQKQQQQQQQDKEQQQGKDQQQDQDQAQQNQDQQDANQKQDQQNNRGINPQDAQRILDALESQERQTLKAVQDKKANRQMEVEKNW